jgi:hypothetical protein
MGPCSTRTSVSYSQTGEIEGRSGDQIITGTYTATPENGRLLVRTSFTESNGKPNCQGLSAEYVLSHQANEYLIEVEGDELRVCAPGLPVKCIVRMSRSK